MSMSHHLFNVAVTKDPLLGDNVATVHHIVRREDERSTTKLRCGNFGDNITVDLLYLIVFYIKDIDH